ncbi:diacylglycerol kinase [Bifidobacterium sp. 64T4]|uniref:diacylglycerol/lipid kinase family protein n=1 Tax=Bifidobacterium pongonis TaxID=2834432 RepID=UPI001C57B542|nr:diacylglycerol kinase family protein [Bifidobacterium pongonis]MBW3093791.1 diacylglycerol kinase [Bifidobacterium pongonis]MBW3093920.1 diacylglycerol kinase [Bifidobacterium pongonis]
MNEHRNHAVVAVIGNPVSNNGKGAKVDKRVMDLLVSRGEVHGFEVVDLTGGTLEESLGNLEGAKGTYDYLIVVGGDGMVSLGVNAVAGSGVPLGIVGVGSGNDFARGLELPVNRIETAVEGIVGAIVCGSHMDIDMGHVATLGDATLEDATLDGAASEGAVTGEAAQSEPEKIDRRFAGMLSCGIDASINDRANHSNLPGGSFRYFVAVLTELMHMKRYGYHVVITDEHGDVEERDIVTPLLTVANSRHIGGGIELSPYSSFGDGLLDMVWMERVPNLREIAKALRHAYDGKVLACDFLAWRRVRSVSITRAEEGDEPPVLMADGECMGRLPVHVEAVGHALRVLVPPAVVDWHRRERGEEQLLRAIERDGRDPTTGRFLR